MCKAAALTLLEIGFAAEIAKHVRDAQPNPLYGKSIEQLKIEKRPIPQYVELTRSRKLDIIITILFN